MARIETLLPVLQNQFTSLINLESNFVNTRESQIAMYESF